MFLPSPVRDQVTILDIHLASDSNEQAISDHYIFDLETLSFARRSRPSDKFKEVLVAEF